MKTARSWWTNASVGLIERGRRLIIDLEGTDPTRFTTDHAETRFAGHGRQFEKYPSDLALAILPQNMDLGRWVDGCAKRDSSNRLPRPAEPVSVLSVVKSP